jgi:thymidylate kinase
MDEQSVDFHRKVRDAYHDLARREAARYRLVDGTADPDTVESEIWKIVSPYV